MFGLVWIGSIIFTMVLADKKGLNMALYFFLSLFLGPVAVFIVLITRDSKKDAAGFHGLLTSSQIKQELYEIKNDIKYLMERAERLEKNIHHTEPSESPPVEELSTASLSKSTTTVQSSKQKLPSSVFQIENFEQVFGKYWLNRIGVILFVIGIGLFISYTFEYLNAMAKVGIGYAAAVVFFFWGNRLEKNDKYTKLSWGILGGAWGLLYLSTFAMHYIQATRIITNSYIAVALLAVVSGAAVFYNLKYRSQVVTGVTFLLAFITASLGIANYSSIIYFSFLVGSIAFIALKQKWFYFLALGLAGSYLSHIFWINPSSSFFRSSFNLMTHYSVYEFRIIFSILMITWMIFSAVFFKMNAQAEDDEKTLILSMLMNAGFFTFMGLCEIEKIFSSGAKGFQENVWFLLILSAVYGLFAFIFKSLKRKKMIVVHTTIACTLLAAAVFMHEPRSMLTIFWLIQMTALYILGAFYKERVYRYFASVLSFGIMIRLFFVDAGNHQVYSVLGFGCPHDILCACLAALCFYMLGLTADKQKVNEGYSQEERDFFRWGFSAMGTVVLIYLCGDKIPIRWLSLGWTALGGGLLATGFFIRSKVFRICALCVLSLASLRIVFIDMSGINTIYKIAAFIVMGGLLLGVSMVYSRFKE